MSLIQLGVFNMFFLFHEIISPNVFFVEMICTLNLVSQHFVLPSVIEFNPLLFPQYCFINLYVPRF